MNQLGSAEAAARRFRRKHLTEKENKKVEDLCIAATMPVSRLKILTEILWVASGIGSAYLLNHFIIGTENPYRVAIVWCFGIMISITGPVFWINRFLAKRISKKRLTKTAVLIQFLDQIALNSLGALALSLTAQPMPFLLVILFFIIYATVPFLKNTLPWLRIWLKLRKDATSFNGVHSSSI